jgi:hypothetical protein
MERTTTRMNRVLVKRQRQQSRRAARRFKAAQYLAYLAFGQDDSPVMGGR